MTGIGPTQYDEASKAAALEDKNERRLCLSELVRKRKEGDYEWLHLTFLEWAWALAFNERHKKNPLELVALYQSYWHVPRLHNALTLLWGMMDQSTRQHLATWLWQKADIHEDLTQRRISCPLRACLHFYGQSGVDMEKDMPELVEFVTDQEKTREGFRYSVARENYIPTVLLMKLSEDSLEWVRENIALNPFSTDEVLEKLRIDDSERVVHFVEMRALQKSKITSHHSEVSSVLPELINRMTEDERCHIASSEESSFDLLFILAKDPSERVRQYVALNQSAPIKVLDVLVDDDSEDVLRSLSSNHSVPSDIINKIYEKTVSKAPMLFAGNPSASLKLLELLSDHDSEGVVQCVGKNPSASSELLLKLAKSPSEGVRAAVAYNCHCPDTLMTEFMEKEDKDSFVLLNLWSNPSAPLSVLKILSRDKDMIQYSIWNPSCPLILLLPEGKRS